MFRSMPWMREARLRLRAIQPLPIARGLRCEVKSRRAARRAWRRRRTRRPMPWRASSAPAPSTAASAHSWSAQVDWPESVSMSEIAAIRALLTAKARPVGWKERRARIDEIGSTWPVADDVRLEQVDLGGRPGEWSIVPGSDAARVLMFF